MHAQPVFYDFEASGLRGFPVEIGWAWLDGDVVKSDSLLIAPADGWDVIGNWDRKAEKIHGISMDQLRMGGLPTASVAHRLNLCLAGRALYSDSPLDQKWMAQLFAAVNLTPAFKVHLMPVAELIDDARRRQALSEEVAEAIAESVGKKFPHTHHARADALYWAELWTAFSRKGSAVRRSPVLANGASDVTATDQGIGRLQMDDNRFTSTPTQLTALHHRASPDVGNV